MENGERVYLGDGLYMEFDGYHIWLITSDGIRDTNKVALEDNIFRKMMKNMRTLPLNVCERFGITPRPGGQS